MKNKLELKHIAPYLPYELKLIYIHTNTIGEINNVYSIGEGYDNDDIKMSINLGDGEHIWMFKPILRPLSDLTKEHLFELWRMESVRKMFDYKELITYPVNLEMVLSYPYDAVQILIKHKYDVFGLIKSGLAIDINTIQK